MKIKNSNKQGRLKSLKDKVLEKESLTKESLSKKKSTNRCEDQQYELIEYGDIFQLGSHRLMYGDASKKEDIQALLAGGSVQVDLVFTDPPYNINYKRPSRKKILNDHMSDKNYERFLDNVNQILYEVLKQGGCVYECIGRKNYPVMTKVLKKYFRHRSLIIWNKNYASLGSQYRTKYELICYCIKGQMPRVWNGGNTEKDVRDIKRIATTKYIHPTEKPIELCKRAIENSSDKGDTVLDVFGGSGSTLMAAEQLERNGYIMELEKEYVVKMIRRYYQHCKNIEEIECLNRKLDIEQLLKS